MSIAPYHPEDRDEMQQEAVEGQQLSGLPYLWRRYLLLERRGASPTVIVLLLILAGGSYTQAFPNEWTVFLMTVLMFAEFIRRMDQGIPLMHMTAVISVLQWMVGPLISFRGDIYVDRYFMYVSESSFFSFAGPATSLFCMGLLVFGASPRQKLVVQLMERRYFFHIGVVLVLIALAADVAGSVAPGGLKFLFHLVSQVRYVGAIYFMFSNHRFRLIFAILACSSLIIRSSESGMFHDLILWLMLLFTYWFAQRTWKTDRKFVFLLLGFCFVFFLQAIKQDYRQKLRTGKDVSLVSELIGVVMGTRDLFEGDVLALATARLNQGWIVSATMRHVPAKEPFADGETVVDALYGAFVPRVFSPEKKRAGGQENFRRFTGLPIFEGTSMSISPLGEAYVNFGREKGILFCAIYGLCLSGIYSLLLRYVVKHPDFMLWLPLVFYQSIKAETELLVTLNQLSKGMVVTFGLYWFLTRVIMPQITGRTYRAMIQYPASAQPGNPARGFATGSNERS